MIIGICDDEKDVRAFLKQKIEQYTDADILLYEDGEALNYLVKPIDDKKLKLCLKSHRKR